MERKLLEWTMQCLIRDEDGVECVHASHPVVCVVELLLYHLTQQQRQKRAPFAQQQQQMRWW